MLPQNAIRFQNDTTANGDVGPSSGPSLDGAAREKYTAGADDGPGRTRGSWMDGCQKRKPMWNPALGGNPSWGNRYTWGAGTRGSRPAAPCCPRTQRALARPDRGLGLRSNQGSRGVDWRRIADQRRRRRSPFFPILAHSTCNCSEKKSGASGFCILFQVLGQVSLTDSHEQAG